MTTSYGVLASALKLALVSSALSGFDLIYFSLAFSAA
jgi:hypothetical protein